MGAVHRAEQKSPDRAACPENQFLISAWCRSKKGNIGLPSNVDAHTATCGPESTLVAAFCAELPPD
jgi:hypothetical protein